MSTISTASTTQGSALCDRHVGIREVDDAESKAVGEPLPPPGSPAAADPAGTVIARTSTQQRTRSLLTSHQQLSTTIKVRNMHLFSLRSYSSQAARPQRGISKHPNRWPCLHSASTAHRPIIGSNSTRYATSTDYKTKQANGHVGSGCSTYPKAPHQLPPILKFTSPGPTLSAGHRPACTTPETGTATWVGFHTHSNCLVRSATSSVSSSIAKTTTLSERPQTMS